MIKFKMSGSLDVSTNATDLSESFDGVNQISGAFTRAKNVVLERNGQAKTRSGSAKVNTSALADTSINLIVEQSGNRYAFAGDDIYRDESSIVSSLTDAQWSAIKYNAFNDTTKQVYALNGTDRKRIEGTNVYEWGIDASTSTITAYASPDGNQSLTGAYIIKFTQLRKVGTTLVYESNPSLASDAGVLVDPASLSSEALTATFDRPNSDVVTHVRVYRTLANGTTYFSDIQDRAVTYKSAENWVYTFSWENDSAYITGTVWPFTQNDATNNREYLFDWEEEFSVAQNVDCFGVEQWSWEPVLYESITLDADLGDELETTNSRPPLGSFVFGPNYSGYCFILKDKDLYYCKAKQPEQWPSTYFVEVSTEQDPLITGAFFNGQPYVATKNRIYYIQGTGHPTFQPLDMKAKTGAQGVFGFYSVPGWGIFHVGSDGLYLFNNSDKNITHSAFRPIFQGETVNGVPGAANLQNAWLIAWKDKLYFGYPGVGDTYPKNVLVLTLTDPLRVAYYAYSQEMRCVQHDEANDRLLAGDTNGFVWQLETGTQDDGSGIAFELQSKEFENPKRLHYPRWTSYDIDVASGATCTGEILLDGTSIQSHTVTGSRTRTRRLIDTDSGYRLQMKLTGSGVCTFYGVETD